MTFLEFFQQNTLLLDGGFGTLLQSYGLAAGEQPERWNITHPDLVVKAHKAYYDAGSNVVSTNTFGANLLKFSREELQQIISAAVQNARAAQAQSAAPQPKFIALDIGPSGKLIGPLGGYSFEDAVALFAETVKIGVKCGVDFILIETMNDGYETKAALVAARENSTLPVFVSNAYSAGGRLMTGATPAVMATMLKGLGATAIGANCSFGPKQLRPVVEQLLSVTDLPILLKPNAGLPKNQNGVTVYDVTAAEFAQEVCSAVRSGVRVVGGCCGTTPQHIAALSQNLPTMAAAPANLASCACVCSYSEQTSLSTPVVLGTRLCAANPASKALFDGKDEYDVLEEAISQQEDGAEVILFAPDGKVWDATTATAENGEEADLDFLRAALSELNAAIKAPLLFASENPQVILAACRIYNGKPLLLFPQGEKAQAAAIAAAKQYGAVLVGKVQGFDFPVAPAFSTLESQGVLKEDLLQELAVAETLA